MSFYENFFDLDSLNKAIEERIAETIRIGHPVKVTASYNMDDFRGSISINRWNGDSDMDYIGAYFVIDAHIFDISDDMSRRFLYAGLLVDDENLAGSASHVVSIQHGTWAHDNTPVHNAYLFRGDDVDAVLAAIKFGGHLNKI